MDQGVFDDARSWWSILNGRNRYNIERSEARMCLKVASDASKLGGGSVIEYAGAHEELAMEWSHYERTKHSNWWEMLMVWFTLLKYRYELYGFRVRLQRPLRI